MKIDIITLHYINHYGSLLQTYATHKIFEKLGHEAEVIDYVRPNADEKIRLNEALAARNYKKYSLKGIIFLLSKKIENKKRREFSQRFIRKYIPMTRHYADYEDLCKDPPVADIYCTGSDQTWNSDYNGGLLPAYFLEFAPEGKKRIGYSVSIGMPCFPKDEYEETKQYIKKYSAISVREDSAKRIVEEMGYSNVTHILDPTLVLSADDWKPLVAKRIIQEKYIIIYKLNTIPEIEKVANNLAKKTGYKIVRMSYYLSHFKYSGKMVYCPDVEEFLSLIYYAEYVLTDSFHCLAFSLNFGKQFFVFYPEKYSTRLRSLLELTGTSDRVVDSPSEINSSLIDYGHIKVVLANEREKAVQFLNSSCY